MHSSSRQRIELKSLTGLRGVAALWVLWYHACDAARVPQLGAGGYLGVDVFFVLSGFVLSYTYAGGPVSVLPFLWKRLARIYPVHLFALALMGLLWIAFATLEVTMPFAYTMTSQGLWQSLLLIHAWATPIPALWNVPSWSISSEWAAYLAFPLLMTIATRLRSPVLLLGLVTTLYLLLMWLLSTLEIPGARSVGMLRIAIEFTCGILLHRLWTLRAVPVKPLLWLLLLIGGAAWLEWKMDRFTALPLLPLLACPIVYGLASDPVLAGRPWHWLGRISYSLYMVHWPVLIVARVLARGDWAPRPLVIAAGAVVSIALAALCYRWIEQPARAALVALWKSRREAAY